MGTIAYAASIPAPVRDRCSAGCTLAEMLACWLREARRLRADLMAAGDGADAEVLRADLAAAERTIDRLIAHGRCAA